MKFVVDMVPINPCYECPFWTIDYKYDGGACKLDNEKCDCDACAGCRWLTTKEDQNAEQDRG